MNRKLNELEAEIQERRNNINLLLRQSALMRGVSEGFNTAEQKRLALTISAELTSEAQAEESEIDRLVKETELIKKGDQSLENKIPVKIV